MANSEPSAWRIRFATLSVVLGLFVSGAVTGAALYRWARLDACTESGLPPRPGPWELFGSLNMSDEQQQKVRAIFDRYKPDLDNALRETYPKVRAIQERIDADVVKVLTDEQRKKFDNARKHHEPPPGLPPLGLPHGRRGLPPGDVRFRLDEPPPAPGPEGHPTD